MEWARSHGSLAEVGVGQSMVEPGSRWKGRGEVKRKVPYIVDTGLCPPNPVLHGEKLEAAQAAELTGFAVTTGQGLGKDLTCLWVAAPGLPRWLSGKRNCLPMQATQEMQFLSPGVGNGNPLLYSTDRGAWQATVHGVAENQTWLSTHLLPLLLGQRDVQVYEQLSWIISWPSFLRQGSVLPCWPPRLRLCWDPSSLPSTLFTGRQGSRSGVHAAYTVEDSSGPRLIRLPCCWWRREKSVSFLKIFLKFLNFFLNEGHFKSLYWLC